MAIALVPILAAMKQRLQSALQNDPESRLILNSASLGAGSEEIINLFEGAFGDESIIVKGDIKFEDGQDGSTLTAHGISGEVLFNVSEMALTCKFGVKASNNLTLLITLSPPESISWSFPTSFPSLEDTFFKSLAFTGPRFFLSTENTRDESLQVDIPAGVSLYVLPTGIEGPLEGAIVLISSQIQALGSFIGPLEILENGYCLDIETPFPPVSLGITGLPALSFRSPELHLSYFFSSNPEYERARMSVQSHVVMGGIDIPLSVVIPMGSLGQNVFQIELISGEVVEIPSIPDFLSIISVTNLSDLLPIDIIRLKGFKINDFYISFDMDSKALRAFKVGITSEGNESDDRVLWAIIPGILELDDISASLLVERVVQRDGQSRFDIIGTLSGTFNIAHRLPLTATIILPPGMGNWTLESCADLELPSLGDLASFAGPDLASVLPGDIGSLRGFTLRHIKFVVNPTAPSLEEFSFRLQSTEDWVIIPDKLEIKDISIAFDVLKPLSGTKRAITGEVEGVLELGPVDVLVRVARYTPGEDWMLTVLSEEIPLPTLDDLTSLIDADLAAMLPPGLADFGFTIYGLEMDLNLTRGELSQFGFTLKPNSPWPLIQVDGVDKLTVRDVAAALHLDRRSGALQTSGYIEGVVDVVGIPLYLSAEKSETGGWILTAGIEEGRTVQLQAMINQICEGVWSVSLPTYLQSLEVEELSFKFNTAMRTYDFKGAIYWPLQGLPGSPTIRAALAISSSRRDASSDPTYSGSLAGSLKVYDLDIEVKYDFASDSDALGFAISYHGDSLQCTLTTKENQQTHETESILTVSLHGISFGDILDYLMKLVDPDLDFRLEAPWNLLRKINFNRLSLEINLTKKTVGFNCDFSLDLGFINIQKIGLNYLDKNGERTVDITIKCTMMGKAYGDGNPLGWDLLNDPAPSPTGSKILDLRLLALGQHVSIAGLKNITKVQDAIAALEGLPADPDKLMEVLSAGHPIAFDPGVSWLVAADFGILRFDESPPPAAPALIGTRSLAQTSPRSGYLLNLAVIFSDPNLYGLRLALDGPAAKIFKGLAFEIMYRKISDTMGVFQTELKLPDAMRSFELGVFTITLPILALEVYTNGDFKVDLGFPWKMDFSRSFMIQGIIPPGIPILGAGGLYFGKLSSGTSTQVPQATNGSFNPVIVFGLGLKLGVGKEIDKGVFKAGISITIVGIIEGVIAKWNPTTPALNSGEEKKDIQDSYYFWLQGTLGIVGKLFGSVDFGVVKAAVNVQLSLYAQITYESYANIPISVIASVSVSLTLVINLGFFKIKMDFSFSMTIKETLVIKNPQSEKLPPWQVASGGARTILRDKHAGRLRSILPAVSAHRGACELLWNNYEPTGEKANLKGYLVPVLTASGTEPCYVVTLLLDEDLEVGTCHLNGQDTRITSFQALCRQVLKWVVAASLSGDQMESAIDEHIASEDDLTDILENCLANRDNGKSPIPLADINSFMGRTFRLELEGIDPNDKASEEANGIVFPMPPSLTIEVPAFNSSEPIKYKFSDCNKADRSSLKALREFFSRLAVQVEEEMKEEKKMMLSSTPEYISMSTFVFEDYFLLLVRQMVQMARDALRNIKYPVKEKDSINDILEWIGANGGNTGVGALTARELMEANKEQKLKKGIDLTLGPEHILFPGDTLASIAQKASLDIMQLASYNADNQDILQPGETITFADPIEGTAISCGIKCDDTLASLTETLGLTLGQVVSVIEAVPSGAALNPTAKVYLPAISYRASYGDTLSSIAESFSQKHLGEKSRSVDILQSLAASNAWVEGLLKPGSIIDINGKSHTIAPEDSLHSLAEFFGYLPDRFAIFVDESNVKGAALNPLAPLMLPRISYTISEGESLGSISKSLGISIGTLAQNSDNLNIEDIFSPGAEINIPHLNQLKVNEILSHIQREGSIDHLAGMASRYMLHGIRLPYQRLSCKASVGKTFAGIVSSYGDVFKLMYLIGANADRPDILKEGTELAFKDSSGKEMIYDIRPGDSLRSIAVSISEILGSSPVILEELVKLTGLQSNEDLLKPDADLVIPLITFREPLNERAGLYELTGQQFPAPDLSAAGEYSFILYQGAETWIPIPDDGLKTVIKKDIAQSSKEGYDKNVAAVDNIQQAIVEWNDPIKAKSDWWFKNIVDLENNVDLQKLGAGAVYKLQPKKFPFSSMAIWQSPEDVPLYLGKDIKDPSPAGRLAEKGKLKIWSLPDSLAELAKGSSELPKMSLYTATFNEATAMNEEEMVGLYSWGTIIDFTVKKVASNPEYPSTGLTYEILGANERGTALFENLLRVLHDSEDRIKDMAILYRTGQPGGGTNCLQSDGPAKQSEGGSDENKISTFIYQVNLTTATRPAENLVRAMATVEACQGKHFADLQYGQHQDYLRLLWESSITRSGGYYLYYRRGGDSTGLPDTIFNDKDEAVISLLIIYDSESVSSHMNCAVTGDHIDQSGSVIFASCSSTSDCAESRGLSARIPLVSPGVIPLEVKREESTESDELNEDRCRLKNMFNMLSYSVNESSFFEGSDLGLPIGPIGSDNDKGGVWVYHQGLPFNKLAKNKPKAIEVHNRDAQKVSIEDPYAPISQYVDSNIPETIDLSLVWQDIFGNRIDEIPAHVCRIPIGFTDALMGLSQWPGMACHYGIQRDQEKKCSCFSIEFDFNTDGYLIEQENNLSVEEKDALKDKAWHDLMAYVRIYHQLLDAALSVETSLRPLNMAMLSKKGCHPGTGLKDSLLKWIWDGPDSTSIISYLSNCLAQGCIGTVPSKPETSLLMELEFNPAKISTESIFRLTVDFKIMRNPFKVHPDFKHTDSVLRASTSISPLSSDHSLQDFAKSFEEATRTEESSLKIATSIDRLNSGSPSIWVARIGHVGSCPSGAINWEVENPGIPRIYAPRPLFNRPVNLNNVTIRDYVPETGKISEGYTRTLNFVGVDVDTWLRMFLNSVEKFLSPEFATAIAILGEKGSDCPIDSDYFIDSLLDSKKTIAKGLSNLLVPALSEVATDDPIEEQKIAEAKAEAQKVFEEDLLIHLSNFYATEAAIQFEAFLNDKKLRLFGSISPGTAAGKSISLTAAKIVPNATIKDPSADTSNSMLTFLLQKQEGQKGDEILKINNRLVELNPVYQITHMEHQIGAIQGIEDYESSSWLTFVNPVDPVLQSPVDPVLQSPVNPVLQSPVNPVLQSPLGSFEVPLILRALPTPPSMVGQYGSPVSSKSAQDNSSELDIAVQFDYSMLYSMDYHEPQDEVDFTLQINRNPSNASFRCSQEGIEYRLAKFISIYPDIEADLEEKLKGVSARTGDIEGAKTAFCAFAQLVEDVTDSFKNIGVPVSGFLSAKTGLECKFSIREYASEDTSSLDALIIETKTDDDWPSEIPHPEVLIEGYTRENNLYKKSDGSYLAAPEGLKIPARRVVIPSLNILRVQDITSSAKMSRNDFAVKLNIGASSEEERNVADSFIYTTSTVGFANPYRPFIESFKEVDISNIGPSNGQSRMKTLEEHLESLLTKLLADSTGSLNLQLGCNYCFKVHQQMPELSLPILLMPHRMLGYVFSWTKIPGTDDKRLKEFLGKKYRIDWLGKAVITKSEDGKTINISKEDKTISLTLISEDSEAILKINNTKTDRFTAKDENGELNIYDEDNGIANLSLELSNLIIKWLDVNLKRKDEGILRFDLTVSTGMTKTSMPLLKLHNLRLDTANITNFNTIE